MKISLTIPVFFENSNQNENPAPSAEYTLNMESFYDSAVLKTDKDTVQVRIEDLRAIAEATKLLFK